MDRLQRLVNYIPFREVRLPLWVMISGVGGALGLRFAPRERGVSWVVPRWLLAWLLCLAGMFGMAALFMGMKGIPLILVLLIAAVSLPARLARHVWRGGALPEWGCSVRGALAAAWRETGIRGGRDAFLALVLFPITVQRVLRHAWRKLAGDDWYAPGYALATAFLGPFSLWLAERPLRWWWRVPLTLSALPLAAGGVAMQLWRGWWILMLVPFLRQGRWLRAAPWRPKEEGLDARPHGIALEPLDRVALAVMGGLLLLLLVGSPRLRPFAPDAYYHLLVAQRIVETGVVPLWDWWEYAPLGRPHLYAPLVHLLIALFSLPFGGDVVLGLRVLQIFMLPTALFSTWYVVRWIHDARVALLTMLILGADLMFALLAYMALPSILANALLPLLLLMVLRRRLVPAIALLAMMLYAHPGVGGLTVLSLLVFAAWEKDYRRFVLKVIPLGVVLALPWYGHVWAWHAWMGHPMRGVMSGPKAWLFKLFWLMNLNLLIMILAFRGLRYVRWKDASTRLMASLLIGFLPMLISYGGRYFAHTIQWWAFFAAVPVAPLLLRRDRRPILAALLFIVFLAPVAMLGGFGQGGGMPRYQPMVSGYILAPAFALGAGKESDRGSHATPGLLEAAAYIDEHTPPGTILHVAGDASLGVMLAYHARRRIDAAAWPEVRGANYATLLPHYARQDRTGCFVSWDATKLPEGMDSIEVGGLHIALGSTTAP